jgi:hypothetical protein
MSDSWTVVAMVGQRVGEMVFDLASLLALQMVF